MPSPIGEGERGRKGGREGGGEEQREGEREGEREGGRREGERKREDTYTVQIQIYYLTYHQHHTL